MDSQFWHEKWAEEKIGFHQQKVNSRLQQLWSNLNVIDKTPVFVPLCGKSLDMLWLHEKGHPVNGIELSEKAAVAFFTENNLSFSAQADGNLQVFTGTEEATGIRLFVGDYFELKESQLADTYAFYDRAALIAMPPTMRADYVSQLATVLPSGAVGLLISLIYDPSKMSGPPFSVDDEQVHTLYSEHFNIEEVSQSAGPERLGDLANRGLDTMEERVYRLVRR